MASVAALLLLFLTPQPFIWSLSLPLSFAKIVIIIHDDLFILVNPEISTIYLISWNFFWFCFAKRCGWCWCFFSLARVLFLFGICLFLLHFWLFSSLQNGINSQWLSLSIVRFEFVFTFSTSFFIIWVCDEFIWLSFALSITPFHFFSCFQHSKKYFRSPFFHNEKRKKE